MLIYRKLYCLTATSGAGLLVLVTAGCAANPTQPVAAAAPAQSASSTDSADSVTSKIKAAIQQAAVVNGDPAPTAVQWVFAPRQAIADTLNFGLPAGQAAIPEILIIAKGNFVAYRASVPKGASAPRGTVLELVLDASTLEATDFGLVDYYPDLSKIGVPISG